MTKREFRRLWAVPADIDARVRRMHRLEESLLRAPQVVTDTVQASGRSAPYALGTVTVRGVCAADGPAARARKRAEVRRMARALEQKNAQYEQDYADALQAIEGIEDAALRCAVQLACLEGMPWEAVADELGATGEAWRKRVERWLDAWEKATAHAAGKPACPAPLSFPAAQKADVAVYAKWTQSVGQAQVPAGEAGQKQNPKTGV